MDTENNVLKAELRELKYASDKIEREIQSQNRNIEKGFERLKDYINSKSEINFYYGLFAIYFICILIIVLAAK